MNEKSALWPYLFRMPHLKPKELIQKSREDLLNQLAALEKKLFELRGQKAQSQNKLSDIRITRRDIARVKTTLMIQQRDALKQKYANAKHVPKDLRKKEVRARRNALPEKLANKMTTKLARRSKFLKPVKFALKL